MPVTEDRQASRSRVSGRSARDDETRNGPVTVISFSVSSVIDTASGPVYSLPIEEVLIADCADVVVDCAVVGVPGAPEGGQCPIAVVQLQADATNWTEEAILEKANKELSAAGLASLAAVIIARTPSDYPLGPTGKVLKRELRTKFARLFADGPSAAAEHN